MLAWTLLMDGAIAGRGRVSAPELRFIPHHSLFDRGRHLPALRAGRIDFIGSGGHPDAGGPRRICRLRPRRLPSPLCPRNPGHVPHQNLWRNLGR